jgi:hypothetical protein
MTATNTTAPLTDTDTARVHNAIARAWDKSAAEGDTFRRPVLDAINAAVEIYGPAAIRTILTGA